ncbi:NfeD family protein [Mycoplasmatota bacterium]|nr:NfeD family protein [Mycoplasmatota bacterium]
MGDLAGVMMFFWIVIIVVAFIIEVNTLDLVSIWFSLGAVFAFVASLMGADEMSQMWVFIGSTIILLGLTRPLAKKYMIKNKVKTNADRLVGKIAKVTKVIPIGERGEVKIDGKFWLAFSKDTSQFEVDERCEVLAIEGVKLLVGKLKD